MIVSFCDDVYSFKNTGEKSYNLAQILKSNINAPHYICITNNDCSNNAIKKDVLNRLIKILENHFENDTLYAIRFSLNLQTPKEDILSQQLDTFLNVSIDSLEMYINRCISSLSSPRISSYIKRHNMTQNIDINIMVQQMITPEYYGVMYTYNPLGVSSERIISIGKDECNDINSRRQDYNTYYYNSDDNIYLVQNDDTISMDFKRLKYLNRLCDDIKLIFNTNLQIDFCVNNDTVYILQVHKVSIDTKEVVTLHRANLNINFEDNIYPLINSFVKECYSNVFSNLILQLTNSSKIVEDNQEIISNMLTTYNGRLYYNINNLYKMFALIPFSDKITPLLEKELNINGDSLQSENKNENTSKLGYIFNMFKAMTSISKKVKVANNKFFEIEKIFNDCYCEELSDIQLKTLYKIIFNRSISKWDTNIINSIYCYFNSYILKIFFKKDINIYSLDATSNIDLEKGLAGTFQQRIINTMPDQECTKEDNLKLYSYMQKIFLHMGFNLVNMGYLVDEEDVYYLTVNELFNEKLHSYKDLIVQRKSLYEFYQQLPNYKFVSFSDKVLNKNINKTGEVILL